MRQILTSILGHASVWCQHLELCFMSRVLKPGARVRESWIGEKTIIIKKYFFKNHTGRQDIALNLTRNNTLITWVHAILHVESCCSGPRESCNTRRVSVAECQCSAWSSCKAEHWSKKTQAAAASYAAIFFSEGETRDSSEAKTDFRCNMSKPTLNKTPQKKGVQHSLSYKMFASWIWLTSRWPLWKPRLLWSQS